MNLRLTPIVLSTCLLTLCALAPATAEDDAEKVLGWAKSAELSAVATGGNAEAETLGFKVALLKTMESSTLAITASGLRAESTATSRVALGPRPFTLVETSDTTLTAENYTLGTRYDRLLSETFFWYVGASWEKNEFAGFSERFSGVGGVGNLWWDNDNSRFRTDYGLTFTSQDDLVDNPALEDTFLGTRFSYDYWRQLTPTTDFGSTLILDQNLDESEDLRADFTNWLSISISDRLALKVSLQALYDNLPAITLAPIVQPGTPDNGSLPVELDELDTIFTTALVINF